MTIDQAAPLPALAAAAAVTSRLRLGTFVLNNDLRHPAVLAQEAATVDLISNGRLDLGMGAGWNQRYNFRQGATYRLKLSRIPGFPGLELYPTLEVPAAGPTGRQFLAHSAAQLELTDEDFRQVAAGKLIVKTVYLPGGGGPAKGPPLLVLRMGNLDREAP